MTLRILTVCEGNLCRSPLAERLLAERLAGAGVDAEVSSAGVRGVVGAGMHPLAEAELERLGGSGAGFAARRLAADQVEAADLVLTATRAIRAAVLGECPRALRRTFTILELAALADEALADRADQGRSDGWDLVAWAAAHRGRAADVEQDVPDPIGGTADDHRAVARTLAGAVDRIVAALTPPPVPESPGG